MPKVDAKRLTLNAERLTGLRNGFSLIELLIVISLFGLAASLITAAYLTFERSQKVKNAALTLKNDIRLAQNKAHTGDKGPDSRCGKSETEPLSTSSQVVLVGWYMTFSRADGSNMSYTIKANCIYNGDQTYYTDKTVTLPDGVTISDLELSVLAPDEINVLFRPLESDVKFYNTLGIPPFFNADGSEIAGVSPVGPGSTLKIQLTGSGGKYSVDILPTGEVNERR